MRNSAVLDELIVGRVAPQIYAFSTNTIPNYLKIGDTYRPVLVRLDEWRKHFPKLCREYDGKATISEDVFFRDYSVHQFLERELSKARLLPHNIVAGTYYSNEFFKNTSANDVKQAISDIQKSHANDDGKYQFYNAMNRLPAITKYPSLGELQLRPNQQEAVGNFNAARANGRRNLLMYAVMRFGKTVTALSCATEMSAKLVVVLSAKADVKEEWRKSQQSFANFDEYDFIDSGALAATPLAISETLLSGRRAVVFLTLQDLNGPHIKGKHAEVFGTAIDLLIIDETHFGARAENFGKVIKGGKGKEDVDDDSVTHGDAQKQIKTLSAKIKLHLSGTPYRILMGSEFAKEDVISFCQFTDIVKAQEAWNSQNLLDDNCKEWDNPYFGFPQMVRFAFNPNASSLRKLNELKASGDTYAFSTLFKPKSITKSASGEHKKFIHEREILDLLEIIDGSKEDDNLLGFLNYDKIKAGKMCRHIVCVLPYCASCDALEELLINNRSQFLNLGDYQIINISGVEAKRKYKNVKSIKNAIAECENADKKTITLTVNRMLTGSTVEQWDTMLYFKDTASPQEYDQAVYRLQNQYIKTHQSASGDCIKFNMKPQTLLVDFDPARMFVMQEQKALIYNANVATAGNTNLQQRIDEELRISPIIVMNSGKIGRVEAVDILNEISNYSKDKGVVDEVNELPVDLSLMNFDDIRRMIDAQGLLGSKQGLSTKAVQGEECELDFDVPEVVGESGELPAPTDTPAENAAAPQENADLLTDEANQIKRFRTYYARILFFAFLANDPLISLDDIIRVMSEGENQRISKNLGLDKSLLTQIRANINPFVLSALDYKIQTLSHLSHDQSVSPLQRAQTAINKFQRLSESEIMTPAHICNDMVALIPKEEFAKIATQNGKILDIASKAAEFATALCKRCVEECGVTVGQIKDQIYSIPTSTNAYEFTRKVYEVLGLNIENIAELFTSYDLLKIKVFKRGKETKDVDYEKVSRLLRQNKPFNQITLKEEVTAERSDNVDYCAVMGNPPYQEKDGGAQASAAPIYQHFVKVGKNMESTSASFIIPSRWYAGGKGLDDFRDEMLNDKSISELHDFINPETLFPNTNIRGGVCYFQWDKQYDNTQNLAKVVTHEGTSKIYEVNRLLKIKGVNIFLRDSRAIVILRKILPNETDDTLDKHISAAKAFGLRTFFISDDRFNVSSKGVTQPVLCYGRAKNVGYVELSEITSHRNWIGSWKVYMPESNNIGTELNDDNQNAFVGSPNTICTETFLVAGADLSLDEAGANNLCAYLKTKFARFLHGLAKASQHGTSKTYQFVPLQDFTPNSDIDWGKSISEIDQQLYRKYGLTNDEIGFIEGKIKEMCEREVSPSFSF